MFVKDVPTCIKDFQSVFPQGLNFKIEYSNPWHFYLTSTFVPVPFGKDSGIYLFTKPSLSGENVPINENKEDIWYIGKSEGNIASRVWQHMGLIYDPETGKPCEPRFKYHQWADDENLEKEIRDALADGKVIIYTIKIEPISFNPQVAEKYLLACFYKSWGRLPILNKDI